MQPLLYKVDIDVIALQVRQEFSATDKAKKAVKDEAKVVPKSKAA